MSRLRRLGRRALVDVTPLKRVPGYRWLFAGMFFAQSGRQLTVVAVPIQVFQITGSTLAVGLLGLAQLVPLMLVSLVGGALADAMDRRRLLVLTETLVGLTGIALLWNAASGTPMLWPLFVLSSVNAGVFAIDAPARQALVPGLVGSELLASALAMNQLQTNVAKAAVPALGGLLIATTGLPVTYAAVAGAAAISALLIGRVPKVDIEGGGRAFSLSSIKEGLSYLKSRRLIQAALLIDLNAMVFGMPTALFPAFGTEIMGGDAFTVGLLYAAPGAGALLGAITSGWVPHVRRQGRAVIIAVTVWGAAIAVFGFARSLPLALAMLAVAGSADVVSAIFRGAIIQLSVPDSLRGRLLSIHVGVVAGGPRLGDLEAGLVAALTSVRVSIVSGGLACILGSLAISRWAPSLRRYLYEPDDPEHQPSDLGRPASA